MAKHFPKAFVTLVLTAAALTALSSLTAGAPAQDKVGSAFDPATRVWYAHPADKWENAFPVGNGRLGAMVFGKTDEEEIQLNEETYWSGGPYSTVVKGGSKDLPEIRKLVFDGNYKMAHILFGRSLMGYPVEQMKYQSLGAAGPPIPVEGAGDGLPPRARPGHGGRPDDLRPGRRQVLARGLFEPRGPGHRRPAHGRQAGQVSFKAQLQGERNEAHSNYATDYFRMDGLPPDGLVVRGKSADYMGVTGALRYESRLKALPEGGIDGPGMGRAQRDRRRRRDPARRRGHELRQL